MTKEQLLSIARTINVKARKSWTKTKIETAINSKRSELLKAIETVIDHHERFSRSYFWRSPGNASARRSMEDKNNFDVSLVVNNKLYRYESIVRCSCNNVYYTGSFYIEETKKNLRTFRELERQVFTMEFFG